MKRLRAPCEGECTLCVCVCVCFAFIINVSTRRLVLVFIMRCMIITLAMLGHKESYKYYVWQFPYKILRSPIILIHEFI